MANLNEYDLREQISKLTNELVNKTKPNYIKVLITNSHSDIGFSIHGFMLKRLFALQCECHTIETGHKNFTNEYGYKEFVRAINCAECNWYTKDLVNYGGGLLSHNQSIARADPLLIKAFEDAKSNNDEDVSKDDYHVYVNDSYIVCVDNNKLWAIDARGNGERVVYLGIRTFNENTNFVTCDSDELDHGSDWKID